MFVNITTASVRYHRRMRLAPNAFGFAALVALSLASAGCKDSSADDARSGNIAITADEKGFTPPSVTLKKGEKSTLVFTRKSDQTCATEVVFPDLKIKKDLPLNTPVSVDIPTDSARSLTFQCGMAMFKGAVVVR
ncbi:MAG TPA: cupredoxin domain-containing protein [Polyangiaceae bacterium]